MVDSHKSTGNGPVDSPVCNPSKKTKNTKQTTKTQQKPEKHTTKTKPKQKQQREVGSQPAWE